MIKPIPHCDGWRHEKLGAVSSTNTICMERFAEGDDGQLWVTATEQLAGKARRGRQWVSKPGNLYASLLLVDPAEQAALVGLPLVAPLALHRALLKTHAALYGRLSIKWPNDILLDGKKLSGILLEAQPQKRDGRDVLAVIIGCGINCTHFPDNPLYPTTSLKLEGFEVTPEELFEALAVEMAAMLGLWNRGQGMAQIRKDWLSRAKGKGEMITARFETHSLEGRFEDVDEQGYLLLGLPTGEVRQISTADIFFSNLSPLGA